MIKNEGLSRDAQEFIEVLGSSLREKSTRVSPVDLAKYVSIAFEFVFNGTQKQDRMARSLARGLSVREKMAAEEGGSLSAEETARLLGVTKQSVLNLYHAGNVLGWRTQKQGAIRFPVWQFVENQRLPGLAEVLAKLSAADVLDDWGKIGFFLQTHGILNDRRPLDLLRAGKVGPALKAAEAYVE